jgi:predicted MFS family arabinose efflux permease
LSFFLLAGNFALIPPATQRLFGAKNGPLIYGLVYSAFGVASVGGNYLSKFLNAKYGSDKVFMIMGLMSMVSTILTIVLKPLKSLASSQL